MRIILLILFTLVSYQLFAQSDSKIDSLLSSPFNLYEFKKAKGQSNSGAARIETYHYKPYKEGIYYSFFLFPPLSGFIYKGSRSNKFQVHSEKGIRITSFKPPGVYQHQYLDPNEILIEYQAYFNDTLIPALSLIGLDSSIILHELGEPKFRVNDSFIFVSGNNALTIHFKLKRVDWIKYSKLNTNQIDNSLAIELTEE